MGARRNEAATDYSNEQYVDDIQIEWLYKPRSLTALFFCAGLLVYFAMEWKAGSFVDGIIKGLLAACVVLLIQGFFIFPSGPFIRPHPAVWRLVFGMSFIYLLFIVVLLFLNLEDARSLLAILFDPDLNREPVYKDYAVDCAFTWKNVAPAVFDRFFIAHFVGWTLKSLLIRNRALCWVSSVLWEILEYSLIHMLPNFKECWWDSILLDMLLCNGLGIEVGYHLCLYLEVQKYDWTGLRTHRTLVGKARRAMLQLTPASWMKVEWGLTRSWRRFFVAQFLIACLAVKELNAFFLKHILWVPSEHPLNVYRLGLLFVIGLPTLRQLYIYTSDPSCRRLGSQALVLALIMVAEACCCFKFGRGMFPNPVPEHIKVIWSVLGPAYVLVCLFLLLSHHHKEEVKGGGAVVSPTKARGTATAKREKAS
eukprot:jgi/Mesvir1/14876/Mv05486-RA.1